MRDALLDSSLDMGIIVSHVILIQPLPLMDHSAVCTLHMLMMFSLNKLAERFMD